MAYEKQSNRRTAVHIGPRSRRVFLKGLQIDGALAEVELSFRPFIAFCVEAEPYKAKR